MEPIAQVDTPSDFGTDEQALVSRWISELTAAEKVQNPWVKRGRNIVKRYVGVASETNDIRKRRFSLLWANIETLKPAVYARTPTAVVGRRYKDGDPAARVASEMVERALNFQLDAMDFQDTLCTLRDDYLLVGRGQAWVRYVPSLEPDGPPKDASAGTGEVTDDTDQFELLSWEETLIDHVNWEDFFTNPARSWAEVRWCARRAFLTRDELKSRFGKKGEECPLDWKTGETDGQTQTDAQFHKAAVFEIWDKISRKVYWVCKAATEGCLDERPDPLKLRHFFPCPRPLLGTCGTDSIIPTPDFVLYESQAREIDELTKRIGLLTDALKVRGYYAGTENQKLTDLLASETNTLIPIDAWTGLMEKGGLEKLVAWFPVEVVAETLKACVEIRKQQLEDVFQITGIADIMRGDTDPNETLGAQKLKANWGSSRVRDKQKEIARFCRDLLNIMGEIIASRFSYETLAAMTSVQLIPSPEAKQQIAQQLQQQAQLAQQAGQPPPQMPANIAEMMQKPAWSEVEQCLKDTRSRSFRVDIETDSTIEPNDQEEKQRRIEFVEAVGEYLTKAMPVVQLAPEMLPVVVEGLKFLVRGFRVGREMEDVIETALDKLTAKAEAAAANPQPQSGDPAEMAKAQAANTNAQANMVKAQAAQGHLQVEGQKVASQHQIGMAQVQAENVRSTADVQAAHQMQAADHASDHHMQQQDIKSDLQQAVIHAVERSMVRDINSKQPIKADTR